MTHLFASGGFNLAKVCRIQDNVLQDDPPLQFRHEIV